MILLLFHFVIVLCYSWGDPTQPIASRLYLPILLGLCVYCGIASGLIANTKYRFVGYYFLIFIAADAYLLGTRKINKDLYSGFYASKQRFKNRDDLVRGLSNSKIFVIDKWGVYWLTNNIESIQFTSLAGAPNYLVNLVESGYYKSVIMILDDDAQAQIKQLDDFKVKFSSLEISLKYSTTDHSTGLFNVYEINTLTP
jgi:hypothetical protein